MNKKQIVKYFIPVAIIVAALIGLSGLNIVTTTTSTAAASGIAYHSAVCKLVTRADGSVEDLGCSHNLFANQGKNITRDLLGSYSSLAAVNVIGLGNGSGAVGSATNLQGLISDSNCQLQAQAGTFAVTDTSVGNWTIQKQFTNLCTSVVVNSTAMYNNTAAGVNNYFAANNFTSTTLTTNDQITITWYIWVS